MKSMWKILLAGMIFISAFSTQSTFAQNNSDNQETLIIIVRHAEKMDDGTSDPPLSEEGKERAHKLQNLLKSTEVTALFSTPYKRTRQTLEPIAESEGLEIQTYQPTDSEFVNMLKTQMAGQTVLIDAHSNTAPVIVNQLSGSMTYPNLSESEYDKIWYITLLNGEVIDSLMASY